MLYHELNEPNRPYSSDVKSLVNIGVVITDIPFCKKEHIKNHKDALTCTGSFLYLLKKFCIELNPSNYNLIITNK